MNEIVLSIIILSLGPLLAVYWKWVRGDWDE